jgi:hypothetical protein
MGQVMGPYDAATWVTMGMLLRDVNYMEKKDKNKFVLAIKAQKETYEHLKRVA